MKISRLDNFQGGLDLELSKDVMPLDRTPHARNFLHDERLGNLSGRKGFLAVNEDLEVDNITNFQVFSLSTGTRFYVLSVVKDEQTRIIVSSTPQMEPAYYLEDEDTANLPLDLNPNVIPYFCVFEDKLYIFNRGEFVYRWGGSMEDLTATKMFYLDGEEEKQLIPSGRIAVIHHSRMWVISLRGDLSAVQFSDIVDSDGLYIGVEEVYDGGDFDGQPKAWFEMNKRWCHKDDGDQITGAFVFRRQLFIFKTNKMFKLVGTTPETYQFQLVNDKIGCPFHRSIVEVRNEMYWAAMDGIYRFNGSRIERTTDRIKEFYDKTTTGVRVFSEIAYDTTSNFKLSSSESYNMNTLGNNLSIDTVSPEEFTLTDKGKIDEGRIIHKKEERTVNPGTDKESGSKSSSTGQWEHVYDSSLYPDPEPYVESCQLKMRVEDFRAYDAWSASFIDEGSFRVHYTIYREEGSTITWTEERDKTTSGFETYDFSQNYNIKDKITRIRARIDLKSYDDHMTSVTVGNVIFSRENQKEIYHERDTDIVSLATKSADTTFHELMGTHIGDNDLSGVKFVNLNPDTLEEWGNTDLSLESPHITNGAWDLKTEHAGSGIVYANGGYDFSEMYRPAWWISNVLSRSGYVLGQFNADFVGSCHFRIRSSASIQGVFSATWQNIEAGDQMSNIMENPEHAYFQVAVVVMVEGKMLGFYIERAQVVGEDASEIPFSIGAPVSIFAVNWENRYMLFIPYESELNNTAIVINRNDAISIFDNQKFQGMIHDFGDRYFTVGMIR